MAASATSGSGAAILVSALIMRDERVLLCHADGAWQLPSVRLEDDEELEEALARLLSRRLGLEAWTEEFLETFYEPAGAGRVIRNVYIVQTGPAERTAAQAEHSPDLYWASEADLDKLGADETLRAALRQAGAFAEPSLPGAAPVYVLTGPPGAGKTTIARLLCAHFAKAAHVEVDRLRDMVLSGIASPIPGLADPVAAAEQIELAQTNAAAVARNFAERGFHVVVDDVLETVDALDQLLDRLAGLAEIYFITLLPNEAELARRDGLRRPDERVGARALEVREILERNGECRGLRLDTSGLTPAETVEQILRCRAQARVL